MQANELKTGNTIEFNWGAMFPTERMTILKTEDSIIAIDDEGKETQVSNSSVDGKSSPIGWKLIS